MKRPLKTRQEVENIMSDMMQEVYLAIEHVGRANYTERQSEAMRWVNSARNDAVKELCKALL
jgi:hypothetical protein